MRQVFEALLPHDAGAAFALRRRAALPCRGRIFCWYWIYLPLVKLARQTYRVGHSAATRAHFGVLDVQLRHAAPAAGVRAQDELVRTGRARWSEVLVAVLLAPLLTGWVEPHARALAAEQARPGNPAALLDAGASSCRTLVLAHNASSVLPRRARRAIFGSMCLAAAIVPTLDTDLPFGAAADAIALADTLRLRASSSHSRRWMSAPPSAAWVRDAR